MTLTVLLLAGAILADGASRTPPPQPAAKPAGESEIVCHREMPIGSRVPKKVCRDKAKLAADQAEQRQLLEKIQSGTPVPH